MSEESAEKVERDEETNAEPMEDSEKETPSEENEPSPAFDDTSDESRVADETEADWVDDTENDSSSFGYYTLVLILILGSTAFRFFVAGQTGLGDAEAYYYAWSKNLSLSYFDHSPAIAYLIHWGVALFGDHAQGVRSLSVLLSGAMALLLIPIGRRITGSTNAGLWGAVLFAFTPVFFIGGLAAAPDILFGVCWLLASWFLLISLEKESSLSLIPLGLAVGVGLLSKYFMVLFWPLALLVLLFSKGRKHLISLGLPLSLLLSLALFSPVLIWNMDHNWASFAYHVMERHTQSGFDVDRFFLFLGGQALYLSPLVFVGLLTSCAIAFFKGMISPKGYFFSVFLLSAPVLAFFLFLGGWTAEAEPHWTMAGWLLLYPVLGLGIVTLSASEKPFSLSARLFLLGPLGLWIKNPSRRMVYGIWMLAPLFLMNALVILHSTTDVGFNVIPEEGYIAKYDLTNELYGWPKVAKEIISQVNEPELRGATVVSYHYTMCGQLTFALKGKVPVRCLSNRVDGFDFFDNATKPITGPILAVTDNRYSELPETLFDTTEPFTERADIAIFRGGREVRRFKLHAASDYLGLLAEGVLPKWKYESESKKQKPVIRSAPKAHPETGEPLPIPQKPPIKQKENASPTTHEQAPFVPEFLEL